MNPSRHSQVVLRSLTARNLPRLSSRNPSPAELTRLGHHHTLIASRVGLGALSSIHGRLGPSSLRDQQSRLVLFYGPQSRSLSTETSTSSGSAPAGPPPGFDHKQAQKPLPKETSSKPKPTATEQGASSSTAVDGSSSKDAKASEQTAVKEATTTAQDKQVVEADSKKKDEKKLTVWQKVKKEATHYWDGTKLLGVEIKISTKLALKMAAGYELSRREHRQLQRTVKDLGRLIPFSVFVIVPFMELLLPVAIRLFPNLLPSTYEASSDREKKAQLLRATRKETSDFLRTTLRESGIPISQATRDSEEFTAFFKKLRTPGERPTREEVIKVCKTFKDDLTLDNLSRPQLVGMCRYMNLSTFGTDMMLRYSVRHRMRQIKRDDRAISFEGVDSLSVPELQMACASRGIRTQGISPARLRDDLGTWLELRLKHGVPSALLVLSNAFMYTSNESSSSTNKIENHYDALESVLCSMPEELYHEVELEVHSLEGAATNKQRLEVLKEQEEMIAEENEQSAESGQTKVSKKQDEDLDEKEEVAEESEKVEEDEGKKESERQAARKLESEKAIEGDKGEKAPSSEEVEGMVGASEGRVESERVEEEQLREKEEKAKAKADAKK